MKLEYIHMKLEYIRLKLEYIHLKFGQLKKVLALLGCAWLCLAMLGCAWLCSVVLGWSRLSFALSLCSAAAVFACLRPSLLG